MSETRSKELDGSSTLHSINHVSPLTLTNILKQGTSKSMPWNTILTSLASITKSILRNFIYKYKNNFMKIYGEPIHKLKNPSKFDETVSQ